MRSLKIKNLLILLAISALLYSMNGCDKISPPYKEKFINTNDTTSKIRKVLLEEYTGHKCPNCPAASEIARDLKDIYGEKLIIIAVHAPPGFYTNPQSPNYTYDFITSTGNELASTFGIASWPNGMIDRKKINGNWLIDKDAWGSIIASIADSAPNANIKITNTYNSSTRSLTTSIKTEFLSPLSGTYNLAVYMTEDSIITYQDSSGIDISNYVHRHVLRGAINSTLGDVISSSGNIAAGDTIVKSYSFPLDNSWNESHCAVVTFVYDAATYEIIQAEEQNIQ